MHKVVYRLQHKVFFGNHYYIELTLSTIRIAFMTILMKVPFPVEKSDARKSVEVSVAEGTVMSDGESDETGSEDESIKYDTIKKSDLRKNKAQDVNKTVVENVSKNDAVDAEKDAPKSPENHIPTLASPILEVEDSFFDLHDKNVRGLKIETVFT